MKTDEKPSTHGGKRVGAGRPRKTWIESYEDVGEMPSDPLYQMEWGLELIMVSLNKIRRDPGINEKERSAAIIRHMLAASKVLPTARIAAAEKLIIAYHKDQNAPVSPVSGSEELTDVSAVVNPSSIRANPRTS